MKTNTRGFSLIELLVALSILAVVAAIIVPKFMNVRSQAAATTSQAQQQTIQNAVQQWLSLGGTCTDTTGSAGAATDILTLLQESGRAAGATSGKATDAQTSSFGSTTISLGALPAGSSTGTMGFYPTTSNYDTYTDGAGDYYTVEINVSDGNVEFLGIANPNVKSSTPPANIGSDS